MIKNTMSFKAIINNMAKQNKVSAQSVLQTYMLERLLERISVSPYKDNFILKGGMLISAMLGIDARTTMDIDTTIKGFKLTQENIERILREICAIDLKDNINFTLTKIEQTRDDDDYGGYKVTLYAQYNNELNVTLKIDITTGDKITHREIKYSFSLMLEDRTIQIWSYNLETIIAEKFESIIKRNVLGTRIRDFYDIHMLLKTQRKNIDNKTLKKAIISTAMHRGTYETIKNWKQITDVLKTSSKMIQQWDKYKANNFYADGINYEDLMHSLYSIGELYEKE